MTNEYYHDSFNIIYKRDEEQYEIKDIRYDVSKDEVEYLICSTRFPSDYVFASYDDAFKKQKELNKIFNL